MVSWVRFPTAGLEKHEKMDLVCTRCGEPDDISGLVRRGTRIIKCPCCPESGGEVGDGMEERVMMDSAIAGVMGNDLYGVASEMDGL